MKTVTGKIIESSPVPVTTAASILSKFVSDETGASQAVQAYLRRANAAFDELLRLHSKSDRRKLRTMNSGAPAASVAVEVPTRSVDQPGHDQAGSGKMVNNVHEEKTNSIDKGKKKEKKREKGNLVISGDDNGRTVNYVNDEQTDKKKKKKKKNEEKGDLGLNDGSSKMVNNVNEERSDGEGKKKKKKKKKKDALGDNNDDVNEVEIKMPVREQLKSHRDINLDDERIKKETRLDLEENNGGVDLVEENEGRKSKKKKRKNEENGVAVGNKESRRKIEINEEEKGNDGLAREERKKRKHRVDEDGSRDGSEMQVSKKKRRR